MKTKEQFVRVEIETLQSQLEAAYKGKIKYRNDLVLINIRGCNGAGKSTLPMELLKSDPASFILTVNGKDRATVYPSFGFVAMGRYFSKTGGLDGFKNNEETFNVLEMLWKLPFSIIMEGVISSTIYSTFSDLFQKLEKRTDPKRDIAIFNLLPPFEVCLERIKKRTPEKFDSIKKDQVEGKWRTVERNCKKFLDDGLNSIALDNSQIQKEQTINWFFENIKQYVNPDFKPLNIPAGYFPTENPVTASKPKEKVKTQKQNKNLPTGEEKGNKRKKRRKTDTLDWEPTVDHPPGTFDINLDMEIKDDWLPYFQKPEVGKVKIRQANLDEYWYWIHERQEIWHKRVVQGLPAPWTEDEILRNYSFTNASRDLDKLTIYYIREILGKLRDNEKSKKEVLLNTMIYRLFCRINTWELFGFLHLDTFEDQWEEAKKALRAKRETGESIFTSAYYVNDLKAANPNPETRSNKTENAICLIEYWYNNLDSIYEGGFVKAKNMEEQLNFFQTLPCVGHFTSYEWACDFAIAGTYTDVAMVPWTIDSYTNVGPGCERGLNWIFEDYGNLTKLQALLYIRSIAKSELKRLGFDDLKLPPNGVDSINLRIVEHSACEYQKYKKAKEGVGRPKVSFKATTNDLTELKL